MFVNVYEWCLKNVCQCITNVMSTKCMSMCTNGMYGECMSAYN